MMLELKKRGFGVRCVMETWKYPEVDPTRRRLHAVRELLPQQLHLLPREVLAQAQTNKVQVESTVTLITIKV